MTEETATKVAQEYYNSRDADEFYHAIWGGEDIHVGIYKNETEDIGVASRRTVDTMLSHVGPLTAESHLLDIGSGYGGAARTIAETNPCRITCLNLSEVQNERNREKNIAAGLDKRIEVIDGAFESIPVPDEDCDVVWSEDSLLHSSDRKRVLEEVYRVLKPGGVFVFTDPMQIDDCPPGVLQPVYDRIHLDSLASFEYYTKTASEIGFTKAEVHDMSPQLTRHYGRVREELIRRYDEVVDLASQAYVDRMIEGLKNWTDAGERGYLTWGIILLQK